MVENRMVLHMFFMLLFVSFISGHIWNRKYGVKKFHGLSQLMKGVKKKMININHRHKRKLAEYPCHLDAAFED